jgi:hypothetical protein
MEAVLEITLEMLENVFSNAADHLKFADTDGAHIESNIELCTLLFSI